MNKVQRVYLIIAALLGVSIPFLFIGMQVPSGMHSAILADAAEYSILDEEDNDFWALLPGRTGMVDLKKFYIFNCENPEEVALEEQEPIYVEVGPFEYKYSHNFTGRAYNDDSRSKGTRVSFNKEFSHSYRGVPENLTKEYRVANLAGLKKWESIKKKERFQIAIEGFFETFQYSKKNFIKDLFMRNLSNYYKNSSNVFNLVKGLKIHDDIALALASDILYGLIREENVYEWTFMCDKFYPYIEHEIMYYFGFSFDNFEIIKNRFCHDYKVRLDNQINTICKDKEESYCTDYNISFSQWMYGDVTSDYKTITFKRLHGIYEFSHYTKKFLAMLDKKYEHQFLKVTWNDKPYYHLLDTYFEYPDYKTDPASLLLFENMRKLYAAGRATKEPFKVPGEESTEVKDEILDLWRFEEIARILKLEKENAYMLYAYFEYYVNNTVLIKDLGGDIDRERIANYGAAVLLDIAEYFRDFIDLLIYSYTLHNENTAQTCEERVVKYFTINETKTFMPNLTKAICNNDRFNSNLANPTGWKYFLEASSYPYAHFFNRLCAHLAESITGFNDTILSAMIFGKHSPFFQALDKIKKDVKAHYNTATGGKACGNSFSPYCTKRQLYITQFYQGDITKNPYPGSRLPKGNSIDVWWRLIEPFIEYNETDLEHRLPDLPIEVPVELSYIHAKFRENIPFGKDDVYHCMNYIKLFDTDVIYDVLLHIGKEPEICPKFANPFFERSVRYWIRNVQFGPMFKRLYPEQVYFGYYDNFTKTEHDRIDYLYGDDCTVNPSIGYNPKHWLNPIDETFKHFTGRHRMYTGSIANSEIRRYIEFYDREHIHYRRLAFDQSGDNCTFVPATPFRETVNFVDETDGYQFPQYPGESPQGHKLKMLEPNVFRPLEIIKKTDNSDLFREKVDVNTYKMDFNSKIVCPDGQYISDGLDATSFFQYRTVYTMPRYVSISEYGLRVPNNIKYTYPLEDDYAPEGYEKWESYFMVEPYTGITFSFKKKMMVSLVLHYDNLYKGQPNYIGEFLPLYTNYEAGDVSEGFVDSMVDGILSLHTLRRSVMISFCVIGSILLLSGIALIIRSCFYKPEEITGLPESLLQTSETKAVDAQLERVNAEVSPAQDEGEDLQQEHYGTELKILDEAPINASVLQVEDSHDPAQESLLP